jgi:phosphohistidine phosphatase SixA|tara:strand:- start:122164 stop:122661 length:498 start_codon:yes stop_codon:yes gene_type:complete
MRNIFILRHCEYDDRSGPGPNFDCHLSDEGTAHALTIGAKMLQNNIQPDLIYCSGAKRTRETLSALLQTIDAPKIIYSDDIYGCMPGELLELIQGSAETYKNIMILGHNPAMHGIVQILGQNSEAKYLKDIAYYYGAGTLCHFSCNTALWSEANPANCTITALHT